MYSLFVVSKNIFLLFPGDDTAFDFDLLEVDPGLWDQKVSSHLGNLRMSTYNIIYNIPNIAYHS